MAAVSLLCSLCRTLALRPPAPLLSGQNQSRTMAPAAYRGPARSLFRESWGGEREAVLWTLSGDPSLLEGGGLCPTSGDMGRPERWTGCPLCPDHRPRPTPTKKLLPSCTQGLHPGWVGDGAGLRAQLRVLQESSISMSSPRGGVWRLSWLDRRAHAPGPLGGCWGSPAPPRVGCALGP